MATADAGLFGPSPWEIQQAQQQALQTAAGNYANQTPLQRAAQGMFTAGGQLGGMGAQAMGGVNVAQQQAAQQQEAMQGVDTSTPDGLRAVAKKMLDMGNQKSAYLLAQKAAELEKEQKASNLAQQKQDEAEQFRRDQMVQSAELKKMQLEQAAEAAKLRSEDARYSSDQRAAAAREATAARLQLGQLMGEIKRMGIESRQGQQQTPQLKPADLLRLRQSMGKDRSAVTQTESDVDELSKKIESLVSNDSGLSGITGIQGMVPNYPGGQSSVAQSDLDSIKAKFMAMGRTLQSQQGKLGNMAVQEWKFIQDMVGNLNTNAGKEKLTQNLNEAKTYLDGLSKRMRGTYEDVYAPYADQLETLSLPERKPPTPPGAPKQTDKFVVGKQYKDAKGNVATYQGNGQWK